MLHTRSEEVHSKEHSHEYVVEMILKFPRRPIGLALGGSQTLCHFRGGPTRWKDGVFFDQSAIHNSTVAGPGSIMRVIRELEK